MSLILVVEPDSLHAAQFESLARAHLHAEIVMADSADRAVAALAQRVPDIVLTTPLLPGRDEEVLSKYLRALGAAAAHVQTLTIPILSASAAAPERTVLGRLRRDRSRPENTDGCDPAMFADQIGQYLRRARQSRGDADGQPIAVPTSMPTPIPTAIPVEEVEEVVEQVEEVTSSDYLADDLTEAVTDDVVHDVDDVVDDVDDVIVMESLGEDVDLSALLNELAASSLPPIAPVAPVVPTAPSIPLALPRGHSKPAEPPSQPAWLDGEVLVPTVMPRASRAGEAAHRPSEPASRTNRTNDASPRTREARPQASEALVPARQAQPAPVQQIITIPSGDGGQIHASVNVSVAVAVQVSAATTAAAPAPSRRPRAPKPAQDEWGFFDPDQCGFRALIARLDAIAEVEEAD